MLQYSNNQDILNSTTKLNAERLDTADKDLLVKSQVEINSLFEKDRDNFELHVYTTDGNYLAGNTALQFDVGTNTTDGNFPPLTLNVDLQTQLNNLGVNRGQYKIAINFLDSLLGKDGDKNVWVKEISTSRQEVRITLSKSYLPQLLRLLELRYDSYLKNTTLPLVLNFGKNRTYQVVNFKLEPKYDLTNVINDSVPQSFINERLAQGQTEEQALQEYAYRGVDGNLIREIIPSILVDGRTINEYGDFYLIENGAKRSFSYNQALLFEFAKYFESSRFDRAGNKIRNAYPYLETGDSNIVVPRLLDLTQRDVSKITDWYPVLLEDLVGKDDYVTIAFRLYKPLATDIAEKSYAYVSYEYREPYIDNVFLIQKEDKIQFKELRPANFDIDVYEKQSIPTEYKTWNELLDANLSTSQKLIDSYFSGSLQGIPLNVNYGEFENFVHFSSAVERIKNFKYKLELIEYYTDRINSVSGSTFTNLTPLYTKRNAIVSTFDGFEKYLFYDSGSLQLYTHVSYSIDPWPKLSTSNDPLDPYSPFTQLYRVSQSVAQTYYDDLLEQATIYDHYNVHRLLKAVPFHVRTSEGNEDFNIFVDMLGHHYDIIWTYINHMSRIYSREEHPMDGMSGELIYHAAKSLGFQLYNGRSTTELWKYALGTNNSGSLYQENVNNITSLPESQVTQEYWRRLLNNLPYLLKTKGTERSIKALLSCFGIPSTLLTITEYGGPSTFISEETHYPQFVHDKFTFAYKVNNGSGSATPRNNFLQIIPAKTGGGNNSFSKPVTGVEFRFRTDDEETYTPGVEYNVFSLHTGINYDSSVTDPADYAITIKKESATDTEGTITLRRSGAAVSMSNVNIFDNNFNHLYLDRILTGGNQGARLYYRKAKYGKIVETGSCEITSNWGAFWNPFYTDATTLSAYRWGNPFTTTLGVDLYPFVGHIQEIRLWSGSLNTASIEEHALSPNTYTYNVNRGALTGNEALEPYNRLVQRYTLSNKNVFETSSFGFSTASIQFSAHPDQTSDAFRFASTTPNLGGGIWLVNASGSILDEVFDTFEETYYTPSPSLGGNSLYTNKVRIEENSLTGFLSPKKRVEKSSFDKYSIDSNKIGIYFSPQDSINEDIFNQLGYYELDDYIGDPSYVYLENNPALDDFAADYWKKYNNKNDFEAFFRALSIYDMTIFKYIKDTLPARANVVSGFLVEPNALERKRFKTTQTSVQDLSHEAVIDDPNPVIESTYNAYEARIDSLELEIGADYLTQDTAEIDVTQQSLDRLGSTWIQNRSAGRFVVSETGSYIPIQIYVDVARYDITGSLFSLNSFSGSFRNAYQYIQSINAGGPAS